MKNILTGLLILPSLFLSAQTVTHGLICGGVTAETARLFVRTSSATSIQLELSQAGDFSNILQTLNANTDPLKNNIAQVTFSGLNPSWVYYARTLINGSPTGNVVRFKTFPTPGSPSSIKLLFGSCVSDLQSNDSAIFVQAQAEKADLFTFTGDWGYPDGNGAFDIYFANPPTSWANNFTNVENAYKEKYSSPLHYSFLQSMPIDYVYDDHDYLNDNAGKDGVAGFNINIFSGDFGAPENWEQPAQARLNSIRGYSDWFPHYPLPDSTEGIYHSYVVGNTEVFVLDTRSMRTPAHSAIQKVGNQWVYNPPSLYTLLGTNQMNWLKNGLSNSTATWKIIVSSVTFNMANQFGLDTCLAIGSGSVPYWAPQVSGFTIPATGFSSSAVFADMWSGYKADAQELLNHILGQNIQNVFLVSGDSHTVGLDDGTNSGIPELMSANLKKANSRDALLSQQFLGYNIWNLGGSGLCQQNNFNSTYGKVQVYGNDSIRLSAVDAAGTEVVGHTFPVNFPHQYNPQYYINRLPKAFPDLANTTAGTAVTIFPLSNDTDVEGDALHLAVVANPLHGTLTQNGTSLSYQPDPGFTGVDTIRYMACDTAYVYCPNCSQSIIVVQVSPAPNSLTDFSAQQPIRVYPVPAKQRLQVIWPFETAGRARILSASGEWVTENLLLATGENAIDVSSLAAGVYFLESSWEDFRFFNRLVIHP
jgi:phosphodiesterase/alkaline phosphatase D-like protein